MIKAIIFGYSEKEMRKFKDKLEKRYVKLVDERDVLKGIIYSQQRELELVDKELNMIDEIFNSLQKEENENE